MRRRSNSSSALVFIALLIETGCLTDPAQYGPQGGGASTSTGGSGGSEQPGGQGGTGAGGTGGTGGIGGGLLTGAPTWVVPLGGVGDQAFDAVVVGADDRIYAGGQWDGPFDHVVLGGACATNPASPAIVHARDASGDFRWTRCFGEDARVTALDVNASGNIAVVGWFSGNIEVGGNVRGSSGPSDVFAVLLSADGGILWGTTFGSVAADEAHGVALGPDDELYISGVFRSPMNIGTVTLALGTEAGLFRAKLVDEATVWARASPTIGGSPTLRIAIRKNATGPLVGAGSFAGSIDVDGQGPGQPLPSFDGDADIFHMGFEIDGSVTKFRSIPAAGKQLVTGLGASNEHIVISGLIEGTVDFDGDEGPWPATVVQGGADAFILSLGFDHVPVGLEIVSGGGTQRGFTAALPRVGVEPLVLAGDFVGETTLGDAMQNALVEDGFFASYPPGVGSAPSFARRVGGGGQQSVTAVAFLDEDLIVVGNFTSSLDLGGSPFVASGVDAFMARFSLSAP